MKKYFNILTYSFNIPTQNIEQQFNCTLDNYLQRIKFSL